ncbi:isopenicillin N synthase family dioxygenase [Variovorax boronicumulans]
MDVIPVIDIAPFRAGSNEDKARVAVAVKAACEDTGFFVITGHGVNAKTVTSLQEDSREFFELPVDYKNSYKKGEGTDYKGYSAKGVRTIGRAMDSTLKPSLVESFAIGMPDVPDDLYYRTVAAGTEFLPNRYPDRPTSLEKSFRYYYSAMREVAEVLMTIFAEALKVSPNYFLEKLDRQISILRVNNYMALESPPEPGEERSGIHTDTGAFTILLIDEIGGLQVQASQGGWLDVNYVPDAFVINIGDTLMRWTNDHWKSTLHRVLTRPDESGRTPRRMSIPFFCQPNYDAVIECVPGCSSAEDPPKYAPITSGEILRARHVSSFGLDKAKTLAEA